ncbi:MAG: hypothetical protein LBT36_02645 [Oscillospiraceae bacterium]|jgi:prophage antirepressor-like protein|nr:hypothetical protein [Oscillospiraceae bacterium]
MKNNNQIQQFHSTEFGALDILMVDGKPHFPATECAEKLGYKNPQKAIRDHCRRGERIVHPFCRRRAKNQLHPRR